MPWLHSVRAMAVRSSSRSRSRCCGVLHTYAAPPSSARTWFLHSRQSSPAKLWTTGPAPPLKMTERDPSALLCPGPGQSTRWRPQGSPPRVRARARIFMAAPRYGRPRARQSRDDSHSVGGSLDPAAIKPAMLAADDQPRFILFSEPDHEGQKLQDARRHDAPSSASRSSTAPITPLGSPLELRETARRIASASAPY